MKAERTAGAPEMLSDLQLRYDLLQVHQADQLTIHYSEHHQKPISTYYLNGLLYVLDPWNSPRVMLTLPQILCDHFKAKGYQSAFDILLRSSLQERIDLFQFEGLELPDIPEEQQEDSEEPKEQKQQDSFPDFDFTPKQKQDYNIQWQRNLVNNKDLINQSGDDSGNLLRTGLQKEKPGQQLEIYHFTHIENAVSIIQEGAIKSRAIASFKDSAGSGVIAQTVPERKEFARFYFRPKAPTQYYVENLGRGAEALLKLGDDPLCPIPVFFIIPLQEAMNTDGSVSIGSLASPQVEYGNTMEVVSKFDFDGVYKNIGDVGLSRFLVAAHQEFLVKGQLTLQGIHYRLGVQDMPAKESLLAMLGGSEDWEPFIQVIPDLYEWDNPRALIDATATSLSAVLSKPHKGLFILQYKSDMDWSAIEGNISRTYHSEGWTTVRSTENIMLESDFSKIKYNLFYSYKGRLWLVQTNTNENTFQTGYMKHELAEWYASGSLDGSELVDVFKLHPELEYWYEQSIKDQENHTLAEHTLRVIQNFQQYFQGSQSLFQKDQDYLTLLALHDIGKPSAIAAKNKYLQHEKTLEMLGHIKTFLAVGEPEFEKIKLLIDEDIIGEYMNPAFNVSLADTAQKIIDLAPKLNLTVSECWPILVKYYQCDAAGYQYLRDNLFIFNDEQPEMLPDNSRLIFRGEKEKKFVELEETLAIL